MRVRQPKRREGLSVLASLISFSLAMEQHAASVGGTTRPQLDLQHHQWLVPEKRLRSLRDLEAWKHGETHRAFVAFILDLNAACTGVKISAECYVSPVVEHILELLKKLSTWASEIEPAPVGLSRFGNVAFRIWLDRVQHSMLEDMASIARIAAQSHHQQQQQQEQAGDDAMVATSAEEPLVPPEALREIGAYWLACFGDYNRIDYGTGHEAHFLAWLYCWTRVGALDARDQCALVTRVFERYIFLMRQLQFKFWLEPAGSHGVWGLDDYHFLPFLFGSAQLAPFTMMRPKSIHDTDYVDQFYKDFMYLACIKFINTVKTSASLRWHSPMLDDISAVKTWKKVNEGMIKMYQADVLGKLPIMQHMLFGSLLPFTEPPPLPEGADDEQEQARQIPNAGPCVGGFSQQHQHHEHHHTGALVEGEMPSCCPRIPSAVASRRDIAIPFD